MKPDDSSISPRTSSRFPSIMRPAILTPILLAILTITGTAPACELKIRVPENNTYAPFFIENENNTWGGLSIELTEALLEETNCVPTYVPLPFSRGIQSLKTGDIDLMLNLSITEERRQFISFIGPQLDETVYLVIRKDTPLSITSLEDFKKIPKPLGVERHKVYGDEFERKRRYDTDFSNNLEETDSVDFNAKKLALGRISGFLSYGYSVMHQIRNNPLYRDFTIHPFTINQDWVYFGLSKNSVSPELLARLQAAYERAKEKGRFEEIRKKYLITPQHEDRPSFP